VIAGDCQITTPSTLPTLQPVISPASHSVLGKNIPHIMVVNEVKLVFILGSCLFADVVVDVGYVFIEPACSELVIAITYFGLVFVCACICPSVHGSGFCLSGL